MAKDYDIQIEIKSNFDEFVQDVRKQVPVILAAIGTTAEGYAKEDCPVDTGLLRNSLTYCIGGESPHIPNYKADRPDPATDRVSGSYNGQMPKENDPADYNVFIGSNVRYAQEVETNDRYHKVGKAHFIRDALQNHKDQYKDIIETAIRALV